MMSQTNVNFRMDAELKREMEALCHELGITMTAAFTIFARKMTREQRIPFDVSLERPRAETLAAMKEADDIVAKPEQFRTHPDFIPHDPARLNRAHRSSVSIAP